MTILRGQVIVDNGALVGKSDAAAGCGGAWRVTCWGGRPYERRAGQSKRRIGVTTRRPR